MKAQKNENTATPAQALERVRVLITQNNMHQAEKLCRGIINVEPDFDPAYFQLGMMAVHFNNLKAAADLIKQAATINPENDEYHRVLCEVLRRLGAPKIAIEHGQKATELNPKNAESFYNLGIAHFDCQQFDEAIIAYKQALLLKPDFGAAYNNLGSVYELQGDDEAALENYKAAVKESSTNAQAFNNIGAIHSARGELDEAKTAFTQSIEAFPGFIEAHHNLSTLKKYTPDDPHLAAMESMLKNVRSMPLDVRMRFWFAIGKAWDDIGKFDEAFQAFQRGNNLMRKTFKYDVADTEFFADDMMSKYDPAFAKKPAKGYEDSTPIFILGMPRSGTTLIEQVLSTHSKVHGAGELKEFFDVIREEKGQTPKGLVMDWFKDLDDKALQNIGKAYVDRVRALSPDVPHIIDKMPGNFFYVGLIHKILPNAKIIYSSRNPMDIGVSNYTRLFKETMPFAYDLEELGRYNMVCEKMMAHWQKVLPEGAFIEMNYEDNVADFEVQARKLVDFCGLDWEDECLNFYNNDRHVKTASVAQVRKPIYKSSVASWKKYEKFLKPLQEIVEK